MKKLKILTQPTSIATMQFDDMDYDANRWEVKAERIQARELRKLRHQEA